MSLVALVATYAAAGFVIDASLPKDAEIYVGGDVPVSRWVSVTFLATGVCFLPEQWSMPVLPVGKSCTVFDVDPGTFTETWHAGYNQYVRSSLLMKLVITTFSEERIKVNRYTRDSVVIVEGSDTGYMLTGLAVAEQRVVVLHNVTVKQGSDSVVSNAVVINQEDPHLVLHTVSGCAVPLVVFEAPAVQVSLDYGQGSVFVCIVNSTKQLVASDSATVQLPTTAIVNITVVEGQGHNDVLRGAHQGQQVHEGLGCDCRGL